jgi:UDPglucose 6-dehydrogenase
VEVGTTECFGDGACFSPEYYGETLGHPMAGVVRDPFIILGGPKGVTGAFAEAWSLVTNSNARIVQTTARAAELCKLMENAFIAVKVCFCNEMYDLAQVAGVDYNELRELWLMDQRVGRSHTYVYRENRGFGGKCIPKDTSNLCAWARAEGRPAAMLEGVREYNEKLRSGFLAKAQRREEENGKQPLMTRMGANGRGYSSRGDAEDAENAGMTGAGNEPDRS